MSSYTTPLSAGEIEEAKETVERYRQEFGDLDAALSMLTAPLAPELAEAVEEISQELALPPCWCEGGGVGELDGQGPCFFEVDEKHLRALLRLVRAQHTGLTELQTNVLRVSTNTMGNPLSTQRQMDECANAIRAAFAAAFEKGGGE